MKLNLMRHGEWRRLLVDTLVVLIGVLAALVLNNIREDIMAKRSARDVTVRLIQEVKLNAEELRNTREVVERRLSLLREVREQLPAGKSLKDLMEQFRGYWVVDLSSASWEYLSRSALANAVDPELLEQAFVLYKINGHFERLNGQVQDIVYSELFVSPDKTAAAIDISEAIMWQQLLWAEQMLPKYERFLERYSVAERKEKGEVMSQR